MAAIFDTRGAVTKLRGSGVPEAEADVTVEVITDAVNPLVTQQSLDAAISRLEAKIYLAFLIQSGIILGGIAALTRL